MDELIIRRYQDSDSEDVWNLHNIALHFVDAHGGNGPWDEDLKNIEKLYLNNQGEFLVAIRDDKIVGMGALLRKDDSIAKIMRMRVLPDYQCKGIGKLILKELETTAKNLGYKKIILDTTLKQIVAQKMYEKYGYKKTGRTDIGGFESILYEKEL